MLIEDFNKIQHCFGFHAGIHGMNEYIHSVVLVLLIPKDGAYHFVLQKRCKKIKQPGELCFPGGKTTGSDESLLNTALRETKEEMGIADDRIQIIGRLDTVITPMGAAIDAFIGIAHVALEDFCPNPNEVEQIVTIPLSFFIENPPERHSVQIKIHPNNIDPKTGRETVLLPSEQLGLPEKYRKSWDGFHYGVLVYKHEKALVWGITARFISDVVARIVPCLNNK
jgi:peroxisomal coenzyme A diphosphatase NUDT7